MIMLVTALFATPALATPIPMPSPLSLSTAFAALRAPIDVRSGGVDRSVKGGGSRIAALVHTPDDDYGVFVSLLGARPLTRETSDVFHCRYHEWVVTTLPTIAGARLCEEVRIASHLSGISPKIAAEISGIAATDIASALGGRLGGLPGDGDVLDADARLDLLDGPLADRVVTLAADAIVDQPPLIAVSPLPAVSPAPGASRGASAPSWQAAAIDTRDGRAWALLAGERDAAASPAILVSGAGGTPTILVPKVADETGMLQAILAVGSRQPPVADGRSPGGILRLDLTPLR